MGTTNHYRAFPLPIGTLTAVGKTADLVARITVVVVFAETAFDSIGDFVSTEPIDTSGSLRCVFVAIQVAGAALLVKPRRFGWIALLLMPLTILTLLAQAISPPVRDFPMHRRSPSSARCPGSVAWRSVAFSVSKALEFPPASLTDRPGVFLRSKILAHFADFLLYLLLSGCSIVSVLPSAAPNILYWAVSLARGTKRLELDGVPRAQVHASTGAFLPARHAAHHDAPTGLIKTPLWANFPLMLVTFAVVVGVAGSIKGGVAGAGVVTCCLRRLAVRRAALGSFEVLPCAAFDLCGASPYGACTSSLGRSLRSGAGRVLGAMR
jgi:hypothetical protein